MKTKNKKYIIASLSNINNKLYKIGWRWLPGGMSALIMASLLKLGAWQPLENISYNLLLQLRTQIPWDEHILQQNELKLISDAWIVLIIILGG